MSEQHNEQDKTETKVYPGNLARYTALREARENEEKSEYGADPMTHIGLLIAEELAGLSYILDGIRYAARQK